MGLRDSFNNKGLARLVNNSKLGRKFQRSDYTENVVESIIHGYIVDYKNQRNIISKAGVILHGMVFGPIFLTAATLLRYGSSFDTKH